MRICWRALAVSTVAVAAVLTPLADARRWRDTPILLAQEYSVINDMRPDGDLLLVFWFSSAILPNTSPDMAAARDLLDSNILLGVVQAHVNLDGTVTFKKVADFQPVDHAGKPFKRLEQGKMPPMTEATVAGLTAIMRQTIGKMGENLQVFVFDADKRLAPCTKGGLFVPIDGETYSFETPIPGCPKS